MPLAHLSPEDSATSNRIRLKGSRATREEHLTSIRLNALAAARAVASALEKPIETRFGVAAVTCRLGVVNLCWHNYLAVRPAQDHA